MGPPQEGAAVKPVPKRIGIALFGAIGDVILSTPLLESLALAFPQAHVTYIVGSTASPVLQYLPFIHELIVVPDEEGTDRWADAHLFWRIWKAQLDWSLCLSRSVKLALAFWLSRSPVRLGYTPIAVPWAFTDCLDAHAFPSVHRTEFFLAAGAKLGVPRPPQVRLHYRVTPEESRDASELLRSMGAHPNEVLVAIHPGTSGVLIEKRRWAVEHFVSVARYLLRRPGRRVVLLGGPDERGLSAAFRESIPDRLLDLTGRLTLRQFAAVLQQCRLLVHNDSSPLHLAGAVGTPVLAIFGYQNAVLWGPLGSRDRVVRRDLPCSPCLPNFPCDRSFECIRRLRPDEVTPVLDAMLGDS